MKNRLDQVEAADRFFEWAWKKRILVSSGDSEGLHSLPESEMFYKKMKMMDCDLDKEYDNLRYFEWYQPRPSLMDEIDL